MRPSKVGALFILLGIILLQVASAERIGSCPHVYVRCTSVKNTCKIDEDCLGDQKCCETCGYNCEDPVPDKSGSCPNIKSECTTPIENIENTCKNDQDCDGDEKCCQTCGYNCHKPVPE
ncbi:WAP four-disulfide core domain protein 12-like [Aquarana catesbeiana]|uniref:WAP four-disulfide core domain protein 12-like n=1 Tax=Aquarana catesbeiana TaxID=8400 RepID=UPI003CCA405C